MAVRPGGEYAGRPLHVIWLLDCSGSMAISGKIEALNNAIREVVPAMRKAAEGNPEVQFYVRVIRFSSGATWHIAEPTLLTRLQVGRSACGRRDRPGPGICPAGGRNEQDAGGSTHAAAADRAHLRRQAYG